VGEPPRNCEDCEGQGVVDYEGHASDNIPRGFRDYADTFRTVYWALDHGMTPNEWSSQSALWVDAFRFLAPVVNELEAKKREDKSLGK